LLGEASRHLSQTLGGLQASDRRSIAISHLHMTANRLGLANVEEVYLCYIMLTMAQHILHNEQGAWPLHPLCAERPNQSEAKTLLQNLVAWACADTLDLTAAEVVRKL
jgi:hypothetical protein